MSLAHEAFAEFGDETADVRVSGRLEVKSRLCDDVARACSGGARLVLVDVGEVTTVTPSGMAELMHAVRWARSRRADLRSMEHRWQCSTRLTPSISVGSWSSTPTAPQLLTAIRQGSNKSRAQHDSHDAGVSSRSPAGPRMRRVLLVMRWTQRSPRS